MICLASLAIIPSAIILSTNCLNHDWQFWIWTRERAYMYITSVIVRCQE